MTLNDIDIESTDPDVFFRGDDEATWYGERVGDMISATEPPFDAVAVAAVGTLEQVLRGWHEDTFSIRHFDGDDRLGPGWFVGLDDLRCGAYGKALVDAFRILASGGRDHQGKGFFYTTRRAAPPSEMISAADGRAEPRTDGMYRADFLEALDVLEMTESMFASREALVDKSGVDPRHPTFSFGITHPDDGPLDDGPTISVYRRAVRRFKALRRFDAIAARERAARQEFVIEKPLSKDEILEVIGSDSYEAIARRLQSRKAESTHAAG